MAKTNEKPITDKRAEGPQRGKSRFSLQTKSSRIVLPDRPPREVDKEIVSILLGGDPSSFSNQNSSAPPASVIDIPPSKTKSELTLPSQEVATNKMNDRRAPTRSRRRPAQLPLSDPTRKRVVSPPHVPLPIADRVPNLQEAENLTDDLATPMRSSRSTSSLLDISVNDNADSAIKTVRDSDPIITSFSDFAERWKHGLRRGQLKICEVLFQKTHAIGTTHCVTSFSELGRLSGLKMRQCFNIIAQLEALRFIERVKSEATSNKKDQGSVIFFYPFPKS